MKTKYVFLAVVLATAVSVFAASPAASNIRVEVIFDQPDKFTDVKDSWMGTDRGRDSTLALIKEHLEMEAPRHLAEGQTLTMTFTNVDLAGDFEPERGPNFGDVRIVKEIYPPRMNFSYKLVDAGGSVLKEGQEKLVNMSFLVLAGVAERHDSLRYEKNMLEEWLRAQFSVAAKVKEKPKAAAKS